MPHTNKTTFCFQLTSIFDHKINISSIAQCSTTTTTTTTTTLFQQPNLFQATKMVFNQYNMDGNNRSSRNCPLFPPSNSNGESNSINGSGFHRPLLVSVSGMDLPTRSSHSSSHPLQQVPSIPSRHDQCRICDCNMNNSRAQRVIDMLDCALDIIGSDSSHSESSDHEDGEKF